MFAAGLFFNAPGHPEYAGRFAAIILLSAVPAHMCLALSPGGLLVELKRTRGSPALKLAAVTLLDMATLSFAISILTRDPVKSTLDVPALRHVAIQLISAPRNVSHLLSWNVQPNTKNLLGRPPEEQHTFVLGLGMYAATLRAVVSKGLSSLKRDDDDFCVLGQRFANIRRGKLALKWVGKVNHPTWEAYKVRCQADLLESQPMQAELAAMRMLAHDPKTLIAPTKDDSISEMFRYYPVLSDNARRELKTYADSQEMSQSRRFCISQYIIGYEKLYENSKAVDGPILGNAFYDIYVPPYSRQPIAATETQRPELRA